MDLEIRHLRLVAGIADAGSMTKAAERLFVTQSALSHQLRDIESRFETPFFTRVGRRMILTAAGRRVLDAARRVIGEMERAEEDVRRLAGNTDGIIRVTTKCNTGYHWLAPLLAVYQRRHPRVTARRPSRRRPCDPRRGRGTIQRRGARLRATVGGLNERPRAAVRYPSLAGRSPRGRSRQGRSLAAESPRTNCTEASVKGWKSQGR